MIDERFERNVANGERSYKEGQGLIESYKAMKEKLSALSKSHKIASEEISRLQRNLENMTDEGLQLLKLTKPAHDFEGDNEHVADQQSEIDGKEIISYGEATLI